MLSLITKKENREFLLFALVVVVGLLLLRQCSANSDLKKINKQNINALAKSTEEIKNKDGELVFQKGLLVTSKKQLSNISDQYDSLATELKKEKGKVKVITKIEVKYETEPIQVNNSLVDSCADSSYCLSWAASDTLRQLEGITSFKLNKKGSMIDVLPGTTTITKDIVNLDLITGIKTEDGYDKIFVKSKNPNVVIGNITGAILQSNSGGFINTGKSKKFYLGVSMGYGLTHNSVNNTIGLGPAFIIGINYNFLPLF